MHSSIIVVLAFAAIASANLNGGRGFAPDLRELFSKLTRDQRRELGGIVRNQDATRAQIKQAITEWVAKQDDKTKTAFEEARKKHEERVKERQEEHAKRIASLSPEAKAVEEQVRTIFRDDSLTRRQTCEKINAIAAKATEAVKAEMPYLKVRDCNRPPRRPGQGGENQRRPLRE